MEKTKEEQKKEMFFRDHAGSEFETLRGWQFELDVLNQHDGNNERKNELAMLSEWGENFLLKKYADDYNDLEVFFTE